MLGYRFPSHQFWNSNNPVNTASGGTQPIPNLVKGDNRFTLECRNAAGSVSKTVAIRVNDPVQQEKPIIVNFSANPSSMTWPQNSTTLSWTVTGADSCWATASPSYQLWNSNNPVNTASGGTQPIPNLVKGDNRFTLECRNAAGSVSKTVTVRVNDPVQQEKPIIVNFSANPSSMTWPQNSTTLSWTVTGADSCWATASPSHQFWNSNNPVNTASGGTQPIPNLVKGDNRFTLECRNAAGSVSKTVTVRVNDAPQNVNPKGYLDVASCTEIKGWAFGTNYASVNVRLTEGSNTVTVPANENRQDVGDVYPDAGDWHGFSIATPNIFKDSNSHTIHAYIQGTNTEL